MPTDGNASLSSLPVLGGRRWHQTRSQPTATSVPPCQQGTLALTYPLSSGLEHEPRPSHLTLVRPAPASFAHTVPDPNAWASRFLQAVVEVISSDRPVTQLIRWTDARVYADIARRQQRVATQRGLNTSVRPARQQVASVHVCRVTEQAAEVAARVTVGNRSRALAARLTFASNRWTCSELVFG